MSRMGFSTIMASNRAYTMVSPITCTYTCRVFREITSPRMLYMVCKRKTRIRALYIYICMVAISLAYIVYNIQCLSNTSANIAIHGTYCVGLLTTVKTPRGYRDAVAHSRSDQKHCCSEIIISNKIVVMRVSERYYI